jgi:pSer/pThr/pTyr-binding forkhead associated (FHA) protein
MLEGRSTSSLARWIMDGVSANPPAAQSVSDMKARVEEAERAGHPFLLFRDGDGRQQLFAFAPGSVSASVGRRPPADLLLDWDDRVSRVHARFERVEDGWEVVDDGLSRNGTFVNEERLRGRRRLHDGDTVRFGRSTVIFRLPIREHPGTAGAPEAPPVAALSTSQRRVLVALCRPYKSREGFASPATDEQIAEELVVSVSAVGAHLTVLYAKLGIEARSKDEARVRLVERAFAAGLISERDL